MKKILMVLLLCGFAGVAYGATENQMNVYDADGIPTATKDIKAYCDSMSMNERVIALPEDIVVNGGFETGSYNPWGSQSNMSIVTDETASGLFSRYLDSNGENVYQSKQYITLVEGETYKLSAMLKVENYVTGNPAHTQVVCDDATVLASAFMSQRDSNGWEYFEDTWVHPAGCVNPYVTMFSNVNAQADSWFDDIKVGHL